MIGLTNFTQMEVEVNVYNSETETVQTQIYKPDPEFPWSDNDANAPNTNHYEKMTLINYENVHFNLIVKRDHPLILPNNNVPDTKKDSFGNIENSDAVNKQQEEDTESKKMQGKRILADRGVKKDSVSNISFKLNNVKDGVNKVISKFLCNHCEKTFTENQELHNHMKSVHKDHFINILEKDWRW